MFSRTEIFVHNPSSTASAFAGVREPEKFTQYEVLSVFGQGSNKIGQMQYLYSNSHAGLAHRCGYLGTDTLESSTHSGSPLLPERSRHSTSQGLRSMHPWLQPMVGSGRSLKTKGSRSVAVVCALPITLIPIMKIHTHEALTPLSLLGPSP